MILFVFFLLLLGWTRHQKFRQEAINGWLILGAMVLLWCCKKSCEFVAHPVYWLERSSWCSTPLTNLESLGKDPLAVPGEPGLHWSLIWFWRWGRKGKEERENIRPLGIGEVKVKVGNGMERHRSKNNLKLQLLSHPHFAIILTWIPEEWNKNAFSPNLEKMI